MTDTLRVILADDHPFIRAGLRTTLEASRYRRGRRSGVRL